MQKKYWEITGGFEPKYFKAIVDIEDFDEIIDEHEVDDTTIYETKDAYFMCDGYVVSVCKKVKNDRERYPYTIEMCTSTYLGQSFGITEEEYNLLFVEHKEIPEEVNEYIQNTIEGFKRHDI